MKLIDLSYFHSLKYISLISLIVFSGCAQIGSPTGGPKDTTPPKLVNAKPAQYTTRFTGNTITLTFDEYIDVQDIQNNLLVSPLPKVNPDVSFRLKTVKVKLRDTLLPNTTYSIDFGNSIRDNNESNPLPNFTYTFSTGDKIDSLKLEGDVVMAETGKADSTLIALLYRNTDDSAVKKRKPEYMAKLNGKGQFVFRNLAPANYKVYALKDGDGSKTYNSPVEVFAFAGETVSPSNASPVKLFAYAEEKENRNAEMNNSNKPGQSDKKLKYSTTLTGNEQSLLKALTVTFNHPLKNFDEGQVVLCDTNNRKINGALVSIDSSRKNITIKNQWEPASMYRLLVRKEIISDSLNNQLAKNDTLRFRTKATTDYGRLQLRFTGLDIGKHPVLLFYSGEELAKTAVISSNRWEDKLVDPGEYELRILFDTNKNGQWDPGNYTKKLQPEKVITLDKKLSIKADWDNERDIQL